MPPFADLPQQPFYLSREFVNFHCKIHGQQIFSSFVRKAFIVANGVLSSTLPDYLIFTGLSFLVAFFNEKLG